MYDFFSTITKKIFVIDKIEVSLLIVIQIAAPALVSLLIGRLFVKFLRKKLPGVWDLLGKSRYIVEILLKLLLLSWGISIGLQIAGIDRSLFSFINTIIFEPFITIGSSPVSVISMALLVVIISVSFFMSAYTTRFLSRDIYPNTSLEPGMQNVINAFLKYFIITTGVIIGLQVNGINLSVFATLGAGLMVGIGFGLQNVASNFISGVVILLERPIKVGDYVDVNGIYGIVKQINARSTVIMTRENILMIVPNSKFISENVVNWSHNDTNVLIRIPIGISYSSDPEKARSVLLEIAHDNEKTLNEPGPKVILDKFDNSSINLILEVWIDDIQKRFEIISDINYLIYKKFKEEGITIPFPQVDVHMRD